ncbi:MAG: hypothetical protein ABI346_00035 [Candidatus Baltobacteraceae bacterium]
MLLLPRPTYALALIGVLALSLIATPLEARADNSLGAGLVVPSDGSTALGVLGTLSLSSVPVVPIRPQLSGAYVTGNGGRFAVAAEVVGGLKGTSVGGGIGLGKLSQRSDAQTGPLLDVFLVQHVAPLTSLQIRYYAGTGSRVGSALFAGVSFSL